MSGLGDSARRGTTAWTLARLLAEYRDPPAVRLVTQELSEIEVGGLHLRGDCFVSLCHSEGWGLLFGAHDDIASLEGAARAIFSACARGSADELECFRGHLGSREDIQVKLGFCSWAWSSAWSDAVSSVF